ncbi:hypothetical protein [Fodinibius sp.]|uniref:hypothetical protein n=1 Tax=Fodinibius sp. TaxID=1872440 RepID=UPI002ACF08A4|nr:hypothetical protein [Fodinibius sp.]MDZ7658329.1 hypothetical protein [Fodinibius sp.]
MNRLRTYIIRLSVIAVICTGFGLYMVQQVQVNHSSKVFANWLSTKVEASDDVSLQKELEDLRKSANSLDEFVKEASQFVKSNNESFGFSFAESTASMHFYQLLLIEWSQIQTGNAMAGIPIPSVTKAFFSIVLDQKGAIGSAAGLSLISEYLWCVESYRLDFDEYFVTAMQPMTEGIAIGAP